MFNFSGKSVRYDRRNFTEVDLPTFWRTLDATHFLPLTPHCLSAKRREFLDQIPAFLPTHEHGTFLPLHSDSDIVSQLRSAMLQRSLSSYTGYLEQGTPADSPAVNIAKEHDSDKAPSVTSPQAESSKDAPAERESHSNLIAGYRVLAVEDRVASNPGRKLDEAEQQALHRLQELSAANESSVKLFACTK